MYNTVLRAKLDEVDVTVKEGHIVVTQRCERIREIVGGNAPVDRGNKDEAFRQELHRRVKPLLETYTEFEIINAVRSLGSKMVIDEINKNRENERKIQVN